MLKRIWIAACLLYLLCAGAAAEEYVEERVITVSPLTAVLPVTGGSVEVSAKEIDGETWLFLPSFASSDTLLLSLDGQSVEMGEWVETEEEGIFCADIDSDGESLMEVYVMQSANLRTLFLYSDDPVNEGREYIDNCERHVNFTTASMSIVDRDGTVDHADDITKLRGRGNGTWSREKKPYQFKLASKVDLLKTGDPAEKERTWVLLSEMTGSTMLHNRISLDLGLEMGMKETPRSEHVDLYYDGDYRGTYLLTEKVEIGEGRVDEVDYDELMEEWNDRAGKTDLSLLEVGSGVNRFGNPYTYIEGVEESRYPDAGAYLLEMESNLTLSDRCYFHMSDGTWVASKNPENPSRTMMEYISTRLQEARDTLRNGGVNPETGRTLEEDFDVEAFVRNILVHEFAYNYDGYLYSSTFFVLPAASERFEPGPLWDFDLGYRYMVDGANVGATGMKGSTGWIYDFYQCDAFVQRMREVYRDELYPMIRNILLGNEEGTYLKPVDQYLEQIAASTRMNEQLWDLGRMNRYLYGFDYEGEVELLKRFIDERSEWLYGALAEDPYGRDDIVLWASGIYAHVEDLVHVLERPWNNAKLQPFHWEMISEADEENYAVWQLEILLTPDADCENPRVIINDTEVPHEVMEDGKLRVLVTFEDPSYRPVDYYGDDIGWIYNYDEYILNHPEVLEICGEDPEAVMEYFCDEGMYEDHQGNAFFRPSKVLAAHPQLEYTLGDDWSMYYWDYLYYGRDPDKWTRYMGQCFWLEVENALE